MKEKGSSSQVLLIGVSASERFPSAEPPPQCSMGYFLLFDVIFMERMRRACATDRCSKESALSMEDHVSSPPAPFTRVDEEAANEH